MGIMLPPYVALAWLEDRLAVETRPGTIAYIHRAIEFTKRRIKLEA